MKAFTEAPALGGLPRRESAPVAAAARPRGAANRGRNTTVAAAVIGFHAAALWALQSGLSRPIVVPVVPVAMSSELVPPAAQIEPPAPRPQPVPAPVAPAAARKVELALPARPVQIAHAAPALDAPTGAAQPQSPAVPGAAALSPAAPEPAPAPAAVAPAPVAAPSPTAPAAPPKLELPSSDADYLQNPKPVYPATSKRLGEQGTVVLRVLIGADGAAQRAEIRQSSGFDRLDQTALSTVLRWRYVPGRRGGVAEAMWFNVPIHFVLE